MPDKSENQTMQVTEIPNDLLLSFSGFQTPKNFDEFTIHWQKCADGSRELAKANFFRQKKILFGQFFLVGQNDWHILTQTDRGTQRSKAWETNWKWKLFSLVFLVLWNVPKTVSWLLIEIGQTKNGIDRLWFCCGFSLWNDKKMNNLNRRHLDIIVVRHQLIDRRSVLYWLFCSWRIKNKSRDEVTA